MFKMAYKTQDLDGPLATIVFSPIGSQFFFVPYLYTKEPLRILYDYE